MVAKLRDGTLSERLSSLELLNSWKAPIEQIDPWIPESINEDRLAKLNTWLEDQSSESGADQKGLSPKEIVEADRLLNLMVTGDAAAAAAMREQLSRMGNDVLPFLKEAILSTDDPIALERLTAARYRLAASGELVLTWPGGLERMASSDFDEKIQAVDEFVAMATRGDEELLLALFGDSSPLVREIAIRTLQRVSGKSANSALVKLLKDPDPNVRAAVLKQLAEAPSATLVSKIAEYVAEETDPDLIVHAIRFLREINKGSAVEALTPLFEHVSWRVRADAVDAVSRLVGKSDVKKQIDTSKIRDSFRKRLQDEDAFVVSRAVAGLDVLSTADALDELIGTVQRHPALASEVINMLVGNSTYRNGLDDHLREFCKHENPDVRAAAIFGLIQHVKSDAEAEALTGLKDEESKVRIWTLHALFAVNLQEVQSRQKASIDVFVEPEAKPEGFLANGLSFLNSSKANNKNDSEQDGENPKGEKTTSRQDEQLTNLRNLKGFGNWVYNLAPHVQDFLESDNPSEGMEAARFLSLLGDEKAIDFLMKKADQRKHIGQIASTFPALLWEEKKFLANKLLNTAQSNDEIIVVATQLAQGEDKRAAELLWNLLDSPQANGQLVQSLHHIFLDEYFSVNVYNLDEAPAAERKFFHDSVTKYAENGTTWQLLAALQLQVAADPKIAATLAESIFEEEERPVEVRQQALNVMLWSLDSISARELSLSLLDSAEPSFAETALASLALEADGVAKLNGGIQLYSYNDEHRSSFSYVEAKPIVPEAPEGLTLDQLDRFTESSNPQVLAYVGYFQAILGEEAYLPALIAAWEGNPGDVKIRHLLYRALARRNDPQYFPIVEEIYHQIQNQKYAESSIKEFYWTIRTMTGPEVLILRKEIRKTHGADALQ